MSYKKKNNSKDIMHQQAYERPKEMQRFGDSKVRDKAYGRDHETDIVSGKIYSYSTYRTYWKHIKCFLKYIDENHPECRKMDEVEMYVSEWLQTRVDPGLSAWTIQTEAAALNKLFDIKKDDTKRFQPPKRRKADIVRSHGAKKRDYHVEVGNI